MVRISAEEISIYTKSYQFWNILLELCNEQDIYL